MKDLNTKNQDSDMKESKKNEYEKEIKESYKCESERFTNSNTAKNLVSKLEMVGISTVFEAATAYVMIASNKYNYDYYVRVLDEDGPTMYYKYIALGLNDYHDLLKLYDDYIRNLRYEKEIETDEFETDMRYQFLRYMRHYVSMFYITSPGIKEINIFRAYLEEIGVYNNLQSTVEIINKKEYENKSVKGFLKEYTPQKIKEYLDEYIIGQDDAKKTISLVFYEHLMRICYPERKLRKNNLLLVGPSGCGKTELLRVLNLISPVSISFFDAAGMSSDGWKGDKKVSSIIESAAYAVRNKFNYISSGERLNAIQESIVFVDEFDKVIKPAYSHGENVALAIQGELLKLFEDGEITLKGNLLYNEDYLNNCCSAPDVTVSTKNILFICAGAFSDLKTPKESNKSIGFLASLNPMENQTKYCQEDIIKYGMSPELAGRIPIVETLNALTMDDYVDIMKNKRNSPIYDFKTALENGFDYKIRFSEESYYDIANHIYNGVGARGIHTILSDLKNKIVYSVPFGSEIMIAGHDRFQIIQPKLIPEN